MIEQFAVISSSVWINVGTPYRLDFLHSLTLRWTAAVQSVNLLVQSHYKFHNSERPLGVITYPSLPRCWSKKFPFIEWPWIKGQKRKVSARIADSANERYNVTALKAHLFCEIKHFYISLPLLGDNHQKCMFRSLIFQSLVDSLLWL